MDERDEREETPVAQAWAPATDAVLPLTGEGIAQEVLAVLEQRARDIAGTDGRGADVDGEEHLAFTRGPLRMAVPAANVVRLLGAPRVTRIPCAPPLIGRVVHVDGRIVSVADPTEVLGVERESPLPTSRVLLVEWQGTWLGLFVDEVHGLRPVPASQVAPPTEAQGAMHPAVTGTAPGMNLILDPEWLVEELKNRRRGQA